MVIQVQVQYPKLYKILMLSQNLSKGNEIFFTPQNQLSKFPILLQYLTRPKLKMQSEHNYFQDFHFGSPHGFRFHVGTDERRVSWPMVTCYFPSGILVRSILSSNIYLVNFSDGCGKASALGRPEY